MMISKYHIKNETKLVSRNLSDEIENMFLIVQTVALDFLKSEMSASISQVGGTDARLNLRVPLMWANKVIGIHVSPPAKVIASTMHTSTGWR